MSSAEVAEAVGAEGESRKQKRERLRQIIETKSEREQAFAEQMQMDAEDAAQAQTELMVDVGERLKGLRRAHGSGRDQLDQLVRKVLADGAQFAADWNDMVSRWMQLGKWSGEYDALVDGFQVQAAPLPSVAILATRKELGATPETIARCGDPDTDRVFHVTEIADTEGYALLVRAGKITT